MLVTAPGIWSLKSVCARPSHEPCAAGGRAPFCWSAPGLPATMMGPVAQMCCRRKVAGMASTRLMLVRSSILLNACLVVYLCITYMSGSADVSLNQARSSQYSRSLEGLVEGSGSVIESKSLDNRLQVSNNAMYSSSSSSSPSSSLLQQEGGAPPLAEERKKDELREDIGNPELNDMLLDGKGNDGLSKELSTGDEIRRSNADSIIDSSGDKEVQVKSDLDDDPHLQEPPREVQESIGVTEHLVASAIATEAPDPPLDSLEKKMFSDLRDCTTRPQVPFHSQRGMYWVLENYIPAAMSFRCDESVTYTTHGEYTFLDNLETLTSRWQGPVSIGVYAPGDDFEHTVNTILYLRDCWAEGIKKFVTFHLIYHTDHVPAKIPPTEELMQRKTDCSVDPPKWANVTTYRQQKKLLYPVNIARNIARRTASTYFVLPSDVELYPSINFITEFFKMLKKPDTTNSMLPKVFVFSIFEVKENVSPPENKESLLKMMKKGEAIPFHKKVCAQCHNVPHSKEWLELPMQPGLSVVHVGKRKGAFKKWEPIYVGTHKEPLYDERLSWEGKSDKMTQMYILCVRDYEFLIMDNAFLVHRPGIKQMKKDPSRDKVVAAQNTMIRKHILPEYKVLFGTKKECVV